MTTFISHCICALLLGASVLAQDVLEVVQAAAPPRTSFDQPACQQTIVSHVFNNSYGAPFLSTYRPIVNCSFTTTIFNLTVESAGRQYDRLAFMFLGDVEVWRTSTAMPRRSGVRWEYSKDMSVFDPLLRQEQKIIFDLGNVVDGKLYTGAFNVTVLALYYADTYPSGFHPAAHILPISRRAQSENATSVFSLPDDNATVGVTVPRNANAAVLSLIASGNGAEEFWYTNVPSQYTETFPTNQGWLYGYGPFREVQVLVDGQLAGVSWPFPVLFAGGVDPGAWRPIVGIDAFDLPAFEIDLTPWLGVLCDGSEHTLGFRMVGYDSTALDSIGPVGENWWVSGSLFVWVDDSSSQTVGTSPVVLAPAPQLTLTATPGTTVTASGETTQNSSLFLELDASHSLSVTSTVVRAGKNQTVTWKQDLFFANLQNMTNDALNQNLAMVISGSHKGSAANVETAYSYPLNLYSAYNISSTDPVTSPGSVFCMVDRSKLVEGISMLQFLTGTSVGFEGAATRQRVTSTYYWNETIVEGTPGKDTSDGETWLSSARSPGSQSGLVNYSQNARESNNELLVDARRTVLAPVPPTTSLPYVPGMPVL